MNSLDSVIKKYIKYNKFKPLPKYIEVLDATIHPSLYRADFFNLLLYAYNKKTGQFGQIGYSIKLTGGVMKYD